jgi:NAD+ diphosphatase
MLGFFARATSTDICVDADEIAYADWYTRDELTAKLESGKLGLPGKSSIAWRLVEAWRNGSAPL